MHGIADLLKESKGDVKKESIELNIEELKTALTNVDSEMKFLPATAQVRVILFSYSILFNGILLF
jgi:NADH:ubiquinone reductase (non-electrogenic)